MFSANFYKCSGCGHGHWVNLVGVKFVVKLVLKFGVMLGVKNQMAPSLSNMIRT